MPTTEPSRNSPKILVVGGACRKAGKTSLIEAILCAFPDQCWTAVKISSHVHANPTGGKRVGCGAGAPSNGGNFQLWEESAIGSGSDTARFLGAGASRALFLEADDANLPTAVASLQHLLRNAPPRHVICETTRAASFFMPELFLMVASGNATSIKPAAHNALLMADATVFRVPPNGKSVVNNSSATDIAGHKPAGTANPKNLMPDPVFWMEGKERRLPDTLRSFIERRFFGQVR